MLGREDWELLEHGLMVAALGALLAVHQKKNSRSIGELVSQDSSTAGYWAMRVEASSSSGLLLRSRSCGNRQLLGRDP